MIRNYLGDPYILTTFGKAGANTHGVTASSHRRALTARRGAAVRHEATLKRVKHRRARAIAYRGNASAANAPGAINHCHPSEARAKKEDKSEKREGANAALVVKMHQPFRVPPRAPPISPADARPPAHGVSLLPHRRVLSAVAGILHASRKLSFAVTFALAARESFALLRTMKIVRGE